jgi:BolA protein
MSDEHGFSGLEATIRQRLQALAPLELIITDQSAAHAGHAGARSGAHVHVRLISESFRQQSRLQRHQAVFALVDDLMRGRIHALSLDLQAPASA